VGGSTKEALAYRVGEVVRLLRLLKVIQRILEAGAAAACLAACAGGASRVGQRVWGARYGAGRSYSRLKLLRPHTLVA
jgi:hypothetical protein